MLAPITMACLPKCLMSPHVDLADDRKERAASSPPRSRSIAYQREVRSASRQNSARFFRNWSIATGAARVKLHRSPLHSKSD